MGRSYQAEVQAFVWHRGHHGATVTEVKAHKDPHHGHTSAALSLLHKRGELTRLTEKRGRCMVYVSPEFVNGREESPRGSVQTLPDLLNA